MAKKGKYDTIMLLTAKLFAKESYCKRRQVIATGYNGTIAGQKNACEDETFVCPKCDKTEKEFVDLVETGSYQSAEHRCMLYDANCKTCGELLGRTEHTGRDEPKVIKSFTPTLTTNEFTVHAEQNIITYCSREGIATKDSTLYITTSPCKTCAKLIAQAGIKRVVYAEIYRDSDGIDFLKRCDIECQEVKVSASELVEGESDKGGSERA